MSKSPSPSTKKCKPNSSGNIHNEFVRAVFAHVELVIEFLKLYIGNTPIGRKLLQQLDLKRIRLETTHFFGEEGRERIADLIFWIPVKRGKGSTGLLVSLFRMTSLSISNKNNINLS